VCRRFGHASQRHRGGRGVIEHVLAVRASPDVRAPLVARDGPAGYLRQHIPEKPAGKAVPPRQRHHGHIGTVVVLGGLAARRVEVQRVPGGESRWICEVPVINRLVVRQARDDVQGDAVFERGVRAERAFRGSPAQRNVDLCGPDRRWPDDTPEVGRRRPAARVGTRSTLAATGQDDGTQQGCTHPPPCGSPAGTEPKIHVAESKTEGR